MNPISRLAQIQQAKKEKEPEYLLVSERGMPRRREFIMQVDVYFLTHISLFLLQYMLLQKVSFLKESSKVFVIKIEKNRDYLCPGRIELNDHLKKCTQYL